MKLRAIARISVIVVLVVGCASAPAASVSPSLAPPATTATATATPTTGPTAEATPGPASPASTPSRDPDQPPAAALGTGDFADIGKLGSYCWRSTCVDWGEHNKATLPLLAADAGDVLIFSMEDGEFAGWTAYYGADLSSPTTLGTGGGPIDSHSTQPPSDPMSFAEFAGPPAGDWIVEVFVRFADGGDAAYAWHVLVE